MTGCLPSTKALKMRVKVAAIVHTDPLCRNRLYSWLRILLSNQSSHPAFVAVEWDEQHFKEVKKQRSKIRALAKSQWPLAANEFYNALESTAAFEADTHIEILPKVPIKWLDQGRTLPNSNVIKDYAHTQIEIYKKCIPPNTTQFNSELLKIMSVKAWKLCDPKEKGELGRDIQFAQAIIKNSDSNPFAWSIAVVGAVHASRDPGSMVALLEAAGIKCDVKELNPDTDSHVTY